MITIHPVKHNPGIRRNAYCGPMVLSLLTGLSPEDAAVHIRTHQHLRKPQKGESRTRQCRVVKGTYFSDLELVLNEFNLESRVCFYEPTRNSVRPTLLRWFNEERKVGDHPLLADDHAHILSAGWHWVLEHKGMIYDSYFPKGKTIEETNYRRKKVSEVYSIFYGDADYESVRRSLTKR